jgi:hypothetical protein
MATNRHPIQRPNRSRLNHIEEMELWLGPSHHGSAFASREELQAAWLKHRDRLMAQFGVKDGKRPAGWWEFEAPFPRPIGHEASALYEANLLGEEERVALVTRWRREFLRAQAPGFFYCGGAGKFFHGGAARRAHYRWCDLPALLLKQWSGEYRRRQGKTTKPATAGVEETNPAA